VTAENLLELTRLFYQLDQEATAHCTDCRVEVLFQDGERSNLQIVSVTHLVLDTTVIGIPLLPDGSEASGNAIQFSLEDIQEVANYHSKHCLFRASTEQLSQ